MFRFNSVETIIILSIIALLAAGILAGRTNLSKQAQYKSAREDMRILTSAIATAQHETTLPLSALINTSCPFCDCLENAQQTIDATTLPCLTTAYQQALDALNTSADIAIIDTYPLDPWDRPYILDANEGEECCGRADVNKDGVFCYQDSIRSYGPDIENVSDDILFHLPATCNEDEDWTQFNINWD